MTIKNGSVFIKEFSHESGNTLFGHLPLDVIGCLAYPNLRVVGVRVSLLLQLIMCESMNLWLSEESRDRVKINSDYKF
jgi:hypothetical protein